MENKDTLTVNIFDNYCTQYAALFQFGPDFVRRIGPELILDFQNTPPYRFNKTSRKNADHIIEVKTKSNPVTGIMLHKGPTNYIGSLNFTVFVSEEASNIINKTYSEQFRCFYKAKDNKSLEKMFNSMNPGSSKNWYEENYYDFAADRSAYIDWID